MSTAPHDSSRAGRDMIAACLFGLMILAIIGFALTGESFFKDIYEGWGSIATGM